MAFAEPRSFGRSATKLSCSTTATKLPSPLVWRISAQPQSSVYPLNSHTTADVGLSEDNTADARHGGCPIATPSGTGAGFRRSSSTPKNIAPRSRRVAQVPDAINHVRNRRVAHTMGDYWH